MAVPTQDGMPRPRSSRSKLYKCIAVTILALVVLTGVVILIVWVMIRPRRIVYSVEDASINGFDLKNNHVNATFDLIMRAYNPNSRVSVYYDSIVVSVAYDHETIAFGIVEPFYQPHHNVTRFQVKPIARSAPLLEPVAKDLRLEKSSGEVDLEVRVKARIHFRVGTWKSTARTLRVLCSPVVVHFSSAKVFERTYCDTDI